MISDPVVIIKLVVFLAILSAVVATFLTIHHYFKLNRVKWFQWEPRDLWIGAYWDYWRPNRRNSYSELWLYICLIPTRPIVLHYLERKRS